MRPGASLRIGGFLLIVAGLTALLLPAGGCSSDLEFLSDDSQAGEKAVLETTLEGIAEGYAPGSAVTVSGSGATLGITQTDADGRFALRLDSVAGAVTVTVTDAISGATSTLEVSDVFNAPYLVFE